MQRGVLKTRVCSWQRCTGQGGGAESVPSKNRAGFLEVLALVRGHGWQSRASHCIKKGEEAGNCVCDQQSVKWPTLLFRLELPLQLIVPISSARVPRASKIFQCVDGPASCPLLKLIRIDPYAYNLPPLLLGLANCH